MIEVGKATGKWKSKDKYVVRRLLKREWNKPMKSGIYGICHMARL